MFRVADSFLTVGVEHNVSHSLVFVAADIVF